ILFLDYPVEVQRRDKKRYSSPRKYSTTDFDRKTSKPKATHDNGERTKDHSSLSVKSKLHHHTSK
ncbi:Hypothetical predicted protein, partial [Marmota monax]